MCAKTRRLFASGARRLWPINVKGKADRVVVYEDAYVRGRQPGDITRLITARFLLDYRISNAETPYAGTEIATYTACTVTLCGTFQFDGVKRTLVAPGSAVGKARSCVAGATRSTTTSAVGCCRRTIV